LQPYAEQVFQLIDSVFSEAQMPQIGDDRKAKVNPLNANFDKKEFQALCGQDQPQSRLHRPL
jgi:type III restriction enzyme